MSIDAKLVRHIVELLQEAIELDRNAVSALVAARVPCNEALANHPTIQVGDSAGCFSVGLLGILNGLCGVDAEDWGAVAIDVDSDGLVLRARILEQRLS